MALSNETKEVLLTNLFYSPNTVFTSVKALYDAVKNKKITQQEVKDFVQKQEVNQLFKRQKRIQTYFPISAQFKFEILQVDLVDMSNLSSANKNYRYLLVCVDVFSRLAFVVPMKNKTSNTIVESFREVLDLVEPTIINCDNGSEFINQSFKDLLIKRGITVNYVNVQDHHKLGIVDRFVRTLREKINKYMAMYNTTKYIDVLPKIVNNYNNSYHSGIKKKPIEVTDEDEKVNELTRKKYKKAKQEEVKFNIGDKVRYILNKKQFEKGTLSKFSKIVHEIISHTEHTYTLDNDKTYKYYELQKVTEAQKLDKETKGPSREQMSRERSVQRKIRQEGIQMDNIINHPRARK